MLLLEGNFRESLFWWEIAVFEKEIKIRDLSDGAILEKAPDVMFVVVERNDPGLWPPIFFCIKFPIGTVCK